MMAELYLKILGFIGTGVAVSANVGTQPSERLGLCQDAGFIGQGQASLQGKCPYWSSAL